MLKVLVIYRVNVGTDGSRPKTQVFMSGLMGKDVIPCLCCLFVLFYNWGAAYDG